MDATDSTSPTPDEAVNWFASGLIVGMYAAMFQAVHAIRQETRT